MATVRLPNLWEGLYRIGDLLFEDGVARTDGDVSEADRRIVALIGAEIVDSESDSSSSSSDSGRHAADVEPDAPADAPVEPAPADEPAPQAPEPQPVVTETGAVDVAPDVPVADDAAPAGDVPTPAGGSSDSSSASTAPAV